MSVSPSLAVVGQPLTRVEDARHLRAHSCFIADVDLPNCREVTFVRSPIAFGQLRGVRLPDHLNPDRVWTAERIEPLTVPIEVRLLRKEFNAVAMPILASGQVRYVGEPIAAITASSRAEGEDIAEEIELDIDALAPVTDAWAEVNSPNAPIHPTLESNIVMRFGRTIGDPSAFGSSDTKSVTRRFSMGRVLASPLEGRGCACLIDQSTGELVVHVSHQRPHLLRSFLAEHLKGIAEADIRVVVPDVGGGFGAKSNLYPEELVVAAMTLQTGVSHRWIEDRYEHFVASNHSRRHEHRITAHFDANGRIHAVEATVVVDSGAYSSKTSTGAIEANMATNVLLGPYDIRNYRFEAISVFTNRTPVGPFRGVGRPAACFAMERIVDEVAHALGMDAMEVRRRNLIRRDQFPYLTVTGQQYDSGDYLSALDAAQSHVMGSWPLRPNTERLRRAVGYTIYVEQAAHGSVEWAKRGSTLVYGHEAARATLTPDGSLIVDVGTLGHGQGHFTSLAQIASEVIGLPMSSIRIRQGDTGRTPYGMGSVASRSIVMAGGAVAAACKQLSAKAKLIAAAVHECEPGELHQDGAMLVGPGDKKITFAEIGRLAVVELHRLPKHIPPGMSEEGIYRPEVETGTFSYGVHAAAVTVDLETGFVTLDHYAVVEDCGTLVNPLIVDGQIRGGVAQGIGQALYEELRYSDDCQPLSVTFGDYTLPSAIEVPRIDIVHLCTPSPFSVFGVKGMGEGGAVAPPAAIANAVRRALKEYDVEVNETPIRPDDLLSQLLARSSTLPREETLPAYEISPA
jgi:aerobic carbon-monoxide dehydrogenase large subunit